MEPREYRGHPEYACAACGRRVPADDQGIVYIEGTGRALRRIEPACAPSKLPSRSAPGPLEASPAGGPAATPHLETPPPLRYKVGVTIGLPNYCAVRVDVEDFQHPGEAVDTVLDRLRDHLWREVEREQGRILDAIQSRPESSR